MMNLNINPIVYRDAILSFLQEKYEEEFVVLKLFQEFEGQTGMAVRALCAPKSSDDRFSVYCYFDAEIADEKIVIDNHTHSVSDAYIGIQLQNRLLEELSDANLSKCIVKCRVTFDPQPAQVACADEKAASILQNAAYDPSVSFYVISERGTPTDEVQRCILNILNTYKPCTGYVYLAQLDVYTPDSILSTYTEKQHDFGNYLANTDFANQVDFLLYKNDTGAQTKKVIKE